MSDHDDTTAVNDVLDAWTRAEVAGDRAALEGLVTDDFAAIGPLGFVLDHDAWVSRFQTGLAMTESSLEETDVRLYGDAAVARVRQRQVGTYGPNPAPEATRATITLVRQDGGWRMAAAQYSFVAGTAGSPPMPGPPQPPRH